MDPKLLNHIINALRSPTPPGGRRIPTVPGPGYDPSQLGNTFNYGGGGRRAAGRSMDEFNKISPKADALEAWKQRVGPNPDPGFLKGPPAGYQNPDPGIYRDIPNTGGTIYK